MKDETGKRLVINEGGINWTWFTEMMVYPDNTVEILGHFRVHKEDEWNLMLQNAPNHPNYYHDSIWKETDKRIATDYFVPNLGWCKIRNPKYIFGYED